MAEGNLRVIFHGQFAFVVWAECIEVLLPVCSPHVYVAAITPPQTGEFPTKDNSFALENGRSYRLNGVAAAESAPRLSPERFPIIDGFRTIDRTPQRLHCSIYLPFPHSVTGVRNYQVSSLKVFDGEDAGRITAAKIPLTYAFTYCFHNSAEIGLDEHAFSLVQNREVLHFYSEPAANTVPIDHAKTAFRTLVRLFPGLDLKLVNSVWSYLERPKTHRVELSSPEAQNLIERAAGQDVLTLGTLKDPEPNFQICVPLIVDNT